MVLKLFNVVRPHFAFFGQKDGQQCVVIRKMVSDLDLDVELVICPTERDEDGLALSSRNQYLDAEERGAASCLFRALEHARALIEERGVHDARQVELAMREIIEGTPHARLDYIAITDTENLEPRERIDAPVLIALAVWIGETRLIDNALLSPPAAGSESEGSRP